MYHPETLKHFLNRWDELVKLGRKRTDDETKECRELYDVLAEHNAVNWHDWSWNGQFIGTPRYENGYTS